MLAHSGRGSITEPERFSLCKFRNTLSGLSRALIFTHPCSIEIETLLSSHTQCSCLRRMTTSFQKVYENTQSAFSPYSLQFYADGQNLDIKQLRLQPAASEHNCSASRQLLFGSAARSAALSTTRCRASRPRDYMDPTRGLNPSGWTAWLALRWAKKPC